MSCAPFTDPLAALEEAEHMVSITRRAHCLIEQGDAIRVVPESQAGTAQVLETVRPFGSARLAALLRDHHK